MVKDPSDNICNENSKVVLLFEDGKGWSGLSNTSNGFELCDYVEDGPMINVCKFNDCVSLPEFICPQLNCLFYIIYHHTFLFSLKMDSNHF